MTLETQLMDTLTYACSQRIEDRHNVVSLGFMQAQDKEETAFVAALRTQKGPDLQKQQIPSDAKQERDEDSEIAEAHNEVRSLRDQLSTLLGTNKAEIVSNGIANVARFGCELPATQHCVSTANIDVAARRDAREHEILKELIVQQEWRLHKANEEAAETARQEAAAEIEVATLRTRRDEVESHWHRLDCVRQEAHSKGLGKACSTLQDEQLVLDSLLAQHRSEKALCHAELRDAEHEVDRLAHERTTATITPMQMEPASSDIFTELRRCLEEIDELRVQLEPEPCTSWTSRARSCGHAGQFAAMAERGLHHQRSPGYNSSSMLHLAASAGPFGSRIHRTSSTRLTYYPLTGDNTDNWRQP